MNKVYISLGSNLGDKKKNIENAIKLINEHPSINVVKISPIYMTEPVGFKAQDWFLNLVVELETSILPQELLAVFEEVEAKLGKKIERKWGPRTIDLDILLYDNIVLDLHNLQIPHKLMHKRTFVLVPLSQIAPNIKHPILNKTIQELLDELNNNTKSKIVLISKGEDVKCQELQLLN